jgi:predicted AlkP superfamily phosphohydrolase/phosphomutase
MKTRIVIVTVTLLVVGGIALIWQMIRRSPSHVDPRLEYLTASGIHLDEFPTLEGYLSSHPREGNTRGKVVFVGIDGAAWNIIDPMIDEGILPTFAILKRGGCHGILRSTECFVSPPAWCSMMTGYAPEKTGIHTFGHWNRETKEFVPVRASDIMTPSVWDIASAAGQRTAVVNVPMTYPVHPVNGLMISGLLTPTQIGSRHTTPIRLDDPVVGSSDGRYYATLHGEAEYKGNRFEFHLMDPTDDGIVNFESVRMTVHPKSYRSEPSVVESVQEFPLGVFSGWIEIDYPKDGRDQKAWCKVRVIRTGNAEYPYVANYSRVLFAAGETDVAFTYPDTLADALRERFGYYFPSTFLDRDIIAGYTADSARWATYLYGLEDWDLFLHVFTQSDNIQHIEGVSRVTRRVYQEIDRLLAVLMEDLPADATLIVASDHGFKEHTHGFDLNRLFEQMRLVSYADDNEIDYDNTLVFHNMWCLYFNRSLLTRSELERRRIPVAANETAEEALTRHLVEAGRTVTVGENRAPFPIEFKKVSSGSVGYSPDMIVVGSYPGYLVDFWNVNDPKESAVHILEPNERWNHARDGIYMVFGNGVQRGVRTPTGDVEDIAATILYLLGLPIARDMDGRVMTQVFREEELAGRSCSIVDGYAQTEGKAFASDEERESLEDKLRSLGYVH